MTNTITTAKGETISRNSKRDYAFGIVIDFPDGRRALKWSSSLRGAEKAKEKAESFAAGTYGYGAVAEICAVQS